MTFFPGMIQQMEKSGDSPGTVNWHFHSEAISTLLWNQPTSSPNLLPHSTPQSYPPPPPFFSPLSPCLCWITPPPTPQKIFKNKINNILSHHTHIQAEKELTGLNVRNYYRAVCCMDREPGNRLPMSMKQMFMALLTSVNGIFNKRTTMTIKAVEGSLKYHNLLLGYYVSRALQT